MVSEYEFQIFQPCQVKKGGFWSGLTMPMIAEGRGPHWVLGSCSPGKRFKVCASNMPFPAF